MGTLRLSPGLRANVISVVLHSALALLLCVLGCAQERKPDRAQQLVDTLGNMSMGFMSLGTPRPDRNETTEELISLGARAVPPLVRALDSNDAVQVGYAANLLKRLESKEGVSAAKKALEWFMKQAKTHAPPRIRFVITCLRDYISDFEPIIVPPF